MSKKIKVLSTFLCMLLFAWASRFSAEAVLSPDKEPRKAPETQAAAESKDDAPLYEPDPDNSVLTMSGGVNYYFDQKETYYNLDMSYVVTLAHDMGLEGEYWVREDGCKMLGDYIMVAANWSVHPLGSLVPTSLGMGIVVDTGEFAGANPTQIDIAVAW